MVYYVYDIFSYMLYTSFYGAQERVASMPEEAVDLSNLEDPSRWGELDTLWLFISIDRHIYVHLTHLLL